MKYEFWLFNIWLMQKKNNNKFSLFCFLLRKEHCIEQSPRNSSSNWSGFDHNSICHRNIFMSYWIIKLVKKAKQKLSNIFLGFFFLFLEKFKSTKCWISNIIIIIDFYQSFSFLYWRKKNRIPSSSLLLLFLNTIHQSSSCIADLYERDASD